MSHSETASPAAAPAGRRFISNVLWSWAGVAVPLLTGVALSPYIIRKLGAEGYGLWALAFSLMGYYTLLDLGFRSAVVRFTAHYHARQDYASINALVNTSLAWLSAASVVALAATGFLSRYADRFFQVSPGYRDDFRWLVLFVGMSISLGVTWNAFTGCVEGFQRFDLSSRIWITTASLRSGGVAVLLALGFGLVAMGVWMLATQLLLLVLYYVNLRRIFPQLRFSRSLVRPDMLKQTAAYGLHTLVATVGNVTLDQGPPVLIGHLRPAAYVGYFSLPQRLLQYTADMVGRAGLVVAPRAAELASKGRLAEVARLAVYVNRYCLALFMPVAIVLLVYGRPVMERWVGPTFAAYSAPLLPVLLLGNTLAMAAQYSSSTVLFGLGKHQRYARSLLAEGLMNIAGMALFVPRYGVMAAAVISSSLMFLNRGLLTPWLVCRALNHPYPAYMRSILAGPLLTALPVFSLAYWLSTSLWPGHDWFQLITVLLGAGLAYYGTALATFVEAEHRAMLLRWIRQRAFGV